MSQAKTQHQVELHISLPCARVTLIILYCDYSAPSVSH